MMPAAALVFSLSLHCIVSRIVSPTSPGILDVSGDAGTAPGGPGWALRRLRPGNNPDPSPASPGVKLCGPAVPLELRATEIFNVVVLCDTLYGALAVRATTVNCWVARPISTFLNFNAYTSLNQEQRLRSRMVVDHPRSQPPTTAAAVLVLRSPRITHAQSPTVCDTPLPYTCTLSANTCRTQVLHHIPAIILLSLSHYTTAASVYQPNMCVCLWDREHWFLPPVARGGCAASLLVHPYRCLATHTRRKEVCGCSCLSRPPVAHSG